MWLQDQIVAENILLMQNKIFITLINRKILN